MKKLFLLFIIIGFGFKASAQDVTACNAAQNICTNPNFLFQGITGTGFPGPLSISNPGQNPQQGNGGNSTAPANSGCLLSNGPGPQWLLLTVSVGGNLGFIFGEPSSANPQVGLYDWAMWLYTPTTCSNLFNNTQAPVACNWNASSSGGTGMGTIPATGIAGNYQPSIPVTAGQQYLILISNYSGVTTPVSFTSTGTASLTCGFSSAICAGQTTTVGPVGFVPLTNPSFTLSPGGIVNNTGTFTVTPNVTTSYTINGIGTNSQNAQISQVSTSSIIVNPQPMVAPTYTQASCSSTVNAVNLHLTFNPPTPAPTYTVDWSGSNPSIISTSQTSVTTLGAGPYTVVTTAAGGCSVVTNFTIDQAPAQPIFTLTPLGSSFTLTCAQPTLILYTTNSNLTYTFTNGSSAPIMDTEAPITTTNVGNGHFTVTATNPVSGCTISSTFSVNQSFAAPPISITPTLQNISCVTTATTVTATTSPSLTNTTFVFTAEQGAISTIHGTVAIYPPPVGTHTVCATNDANGCSTCKTFTVTSSDQFPSLSVTSADNFTVGCGVGYNHAAVTLSTQAASGTQFTIVPAPSPTNPALGGLTQYTFTNDGNYIAIVKDLSNGCETQVPFSIISMTQTPNIDANIPQTVLSCAIPSTALSAITTNTHVTYTWSYPSPNGPLSVANGSILVTTNPTLGINLPTYTLTIKDLDNGCVSTKTVQLQQSISSPSAHISGGAVNNATSAPITCATPSINLNNASQTTIPASLPHSGPVSVVEWDGPSPQTPAQFLTNYRAFTPGTYTLTVMDQNNGCVSTATFLITDLTQVPLVGISGGDTLYCGAPPIVLTATTANAVTSPQYSWFQPADSPASTDSIIVAVKAGIYTSVIKNGQTGCVGKATHLISNGNLSANFAPDHVSGYSPLLVTFANNTSAGKDRTNIVTIWSFGNGSQLSTNETSVSPSVTYTQSGTYTVTIYTSKGAACQDTAVRVISVDIPSTMEIPNVFTPNGDDINDFFFLKSSNLTEIHAMIYDRWGHKVYDLTSTTGNISWDGKNDSDGKDAAAGTYFYIIKATGKDGQTYNNKGTVNLYR